jgi:transcriptional regulator with XRE-family HTH domain
MIRERRKAKKMSLRELAKAADVPFGYLAELEAGKKKNPSLAVLTRLAEALGVKIGKLVD